MERDYDETVAAMAAEIAAGLVRAKAYWDGTILKVDAVAGDAVFVAQTIVREVQRTEARRRGDRPSIQPRSSPI